MFQVQPVQHVYPTQVQYVEGGDAIFTYGALYVGAFSPPQEGLHREPTWPPCLLSSPGDGFAHNLLPSPPGGVTQLLHPHQDISAQ